MKLRPFYLALACGLWAMDDFSGQAQDYTFTTIAGSPRSSGTNDGVNDDARFNSPSQIAIDAAGVLYVSDMLNHAIRRIIPEGTNWVVTTIAGMPGSMGSADGTNRDARFDRPQGIKVDNTGTLFVTDLTQRIRTITPIGTNWVVHSIAGSPYVRDSANGTNSDAHFFSPRGLVLEQSGSLAVVDSANHTLRSVTPYDTNWAVTTLAGYPLNYGFLDGFNELAEFNTPFDITAAVGSLFVTDSGNNAIRQIIRTGADRLTVTVAGVSGVRGATNGPAAQATFYFPAGIAADTSGNLYVADYSNQLIRKLAAPNWDVTTLGGAELQAGFTDGTGAEARFNHPWGITVDVVGNLFVVDNLNHTIRKGTPRAVAAPALAIQAGAGSVVLSWPATATQYVLEAATNLSPAADWVPLTNGVSLVGGTAYFTNTVQGAAAFYRLHRQ